MDYLEQPNFRKLYSEESEQAIIGSILLDPDVLHKASKFNPNNMYYPYHQKILEGLFTLSDSNKPIDAIVLHEYFEERNELHLVNDGLMYLVDLVRNTPSTSNIDGHIKIVKDRSKERALAIAANKIQSVIQEQGLSTDERIAESNKIFDEAIENDDQLETVMNTDQALKNYLDDFTYRNENGTDNGIKTGLEALDNILDGLKDGDFVIVGGRPSMGKTTLATNIMEGMAKQGKKGYFSSLEMPTKNIMNRLIASVGGIFLKSVISADLQEDDWSKFTSAIHHIKKWSVVYDDQGGVDISELCNRWRVESRKNGLDFIMVDYLQLIRDRTAGDNRFNEISAISRKLKAIAKELNVPLIALSQLSRMLESRQDKRPMNSDLRESGQIEQDADVIMFVYRDEVYNEDTHAKNILEVIVTKFRDGELGTAFFNFVGAKNQIKHLENGYTPPPEPEKKQYKPRGF